MKNKKTKFAVIKNGCGWLAASGAVFTAIGIGTNNTQAHGFVGDYFFPPTITIDDPFATDELMFPSVSYFKNPAADGSPATGVTDIGFELGFSSQSHFTHFFSANVGIAPTQYRTIARVVSE